MSPSEIPPLAPLPLAIEALLQAEREAPAPAPAVAARVFRRLGNTLGWPATGAAGSLLSSAKLYVIAALLAAGVAGTLARARFRSTPTIPLRRRRQRWRQRWRIRGRKLPRRHCPRSPRLPRP